MPKSAPELIDKAFLHCKSHFLVTENCQSMSEWRSAIWSDKSTPEKEVTQLLYFSSQLSLAQE